LAGFLLSLHGCLEDFFVFTWMAGSWVAYVSAWMSLRLCMEESLASSCNLFWAFLGFSFYFIW